MNTNELKQPSPRLTEDEITWALAHLPPVRLAAPIARAIEQLTAERIVARLEQACGPSGMPPRLIRGLWLDGEVCDELPAEWSGDLDSPPMVRQADAEAVIARLTAERDAALKLAGERLQALEAMGKLQDSLNAHLASSELAKTAAARDVLAERQRQIDAEGFTPKHDDARCAGDLGLAAALYALPYSSGLLTQEHVLPLEMALEMGCDWTLKPEPDARKRLVKAGALVLAEIERMDRAEAAHSVAAPARAADFHGFDRRELGAPAELAGAQAREDGAA